MGIIYNTIDDGNISPYYPKHIKSELLGELLIKVKRSQFDFFPCSLCRFSYLCTTLHLYKYVKEDIGDCDGCIFLNTRVIDRDSEDMKLRRDINEIIEQRYEQSEECELIRLTILSWLHERK